MFKSSVQISATAEDMIMHKTHNIHNKLANVYRVSHTTYLSQQTRLAVALHWTSMCWVMEQAGVQPRHAVDPLVEAYVSTEQACMLLFSVQK